MSPNLLVPLVLLGILLVTVSWVYQDAANHAASGEPVVFWSRSLRLETPSAWAALCLVLGCSSPSTSGPDSTRSSVGRGASR